MNSEQIANILAFYSYYHPREDVDTIALEFKLPAALIINGLYFGEREGIFKCTKKGIAFKEITVDAVPDDTGDYGKDVVRIKELMLELITNANSDKFDVVEENLFVFVGAPLVVSKVAVQLLLNEGKLAKYRITDPKDPKSKYRFYTLIENKDEMFGRKDFKRQPSKKNIKKNVTVSRRKR